MPTYSISKKSESIIYTIGKMYQRKFAADKLNSQEDLVQDHCNRVKRAERLNQPH